MQPCNLRFIRISIPAKLTACGGLVALADFLFYGEDIGWTAGGFAALLLGLMLLFNPLALRGRAGKLITALTFGQCLALANQPNLASYALYGGGLLILALFSHGNEFADARQWLRHIVHYLCLLPARPLRDAAKFRKVSAARKSSGLWQRRIKVWTLPVCLGSVFLFLFSGANPIIGNFFQDVQWQSFFDLFSLMRMGFWLCTGLLCWPFIRPRIRRMRPAIDYGPGDIAGIISWLFSREAILRSLILFNLLFAIQTSMDAAYLWGGLALPDNMTYADYAHRGAYPLIATALLAAVFVLIALRPGSASEDSVLIRRLVYAWIAQNVFLVVSSIWRTDIYVAEYSLTWLRLSALIWMGLVAGGLSLIIVRIALNKSNAWLFNANILMLMGTLYVCSTLNLTGFIADYNVNHCWEVAQQGSHIDTDYLYGLGPAALPALQRLATDRPDAQDDARYLQAKLDASLSNWRNWTVQNYRLSLQYPETASK